MTSKDSGTAVLYIRVSTKDQAQNGRSMEAQEAILREWCVKNGREVVKVLKDPGQSGLKENRPGLEKALKLACSSKSVFVVYALSRAARSVRHLVDIAARLEKHGADFASATEKLDTSTPAGKMIFHVLAAQAQFIRDLIAENTADAMAFKVNNREFTGKTPIGWQLDPGEDAEARPRHIVPHQEQQGILQIISALHGAGRNSYAIAKHLNDIGIAPVGESVKTGQTGQKWYPKTIARIIPRLDRLVP